MEMGLEKSRQLAISILDIFDDMLAEKGIAIPDDDREGNEEEAPLYGCTYFDLEDKISTLLAPYVDTNNGYYFIVRWCDDDIAEALREYGVEATESNIEEVKMRCRRIEDRMIESGWDVIESAIQEIF